jgi:hypothetical protein
MGGAARVGRVGTAYRRGKLVGRAHPTDPSRQEHLGASVLQPEDVGDAAIAGLVQVFLFLVL